MRETIQASLKQLLDNRYLLVLLVVLVLLTVISIAFVIVTLQPSELRVVTHYSAYGLTHFYRDQWFYLIGHAVFALIAAILSVVLSLKLLQTKGPALAVAYVWFGIAVIVMGSIAYIRIAEFS